tara:strand:+ start:1360 stop:2364 length:1005 start_codon:yes stop_codon:yes gene_type:complete
MKNSIIIAVVTLFTICLYLFNNNVIEGYWNISGSKVKNAYLPQQVKKNMDITNYKPHGTTIVNESRSLETFNYNPKDIREEHLSPEVQFNNIENYQMESNNSPIFQETNYNTRSPQNLPKNNLSDTHIPVRENYMEARGVSTSKVTPYGFRNGAKPEFGAGLLRGEIPIREDYSSGSTPQLGSYLNPMGNIQRRGGKQNANARGEIAINQQFQAGQKFNIMNKESAANMVSNASPIANSEESVGEPYNAAIPRRVRDRMQQENYTVGMPRRVRDSLGKNTLQQYAVNEPVVPVQQYENELLLPGSQQFELPTVQQQYELPIVQQQYENENIVNV